MALTNSQIPAFANRGETASTQTGNFWTVPGFTGNQGHMPGNLYWTIKAIDRLGVGHNIEQTVYSYGTPIAFKVRGVWIRPERGYSATTAGKHQSQLYKLSGRTEFVPMDISAAELLRVIDGKMRYVRARTKSEVGRFVAGPNYTAE